MKITLTCTDCNLSNKSDKKIQRYNVEISDKNIYPLKCELGHESIIFLDSHKFELLFEMGIKAMLDGYFREAVSNFAVSIERFHEFSIEVFVENLFNREKIRGAYTQETNEFKKAWKEMSNRSEMQLGAYTMLYLSVFKVAPTLLNNKRVNFRNNVVHKGYFPTEQETLDYARNTFNYLHSKLIELKDNINEEVKYVYEKKLKEYITIDDYNGKSLVRWGEIMTINTSHEIKVIKDLDFDKVLEERKNGYTPFNK